MPNTADIVPPAGRDVKKPAPAQRVNRFLSSVAAELGGEAIHPRLLFIHALMSLMPFQAGSRIRAALYRMAGFSIGPRTLIYDKLNLWGGSRIYTNLRIGESCRISRGCSIDLNGPVTLGEHVVLGFGVSIITASHNMDDPRCRAGGHEIRPVVIEDGAWVAANALLLPGITVGARSVVGAGSIVTRDVPPDTVVAGNPARVVRTLPTSTSEG